MRIFVPRETAAAETRVPLLPQMAGKLVQLGADLEVESGLGKSLGIADEAYQKAGAKVTGDRKSALGQADLVLRLRKPPREEIGLLKKGCIHISYLDPFNEAALIQELADSGVTAIAMELIPRTTLAQKMDALSSQASLAGYVAVCLAASRLPKILPMMMTPAGTLQPARVLVIGAGVAGLQAIATAKRLGARVEAYDTRPAVEEQIKSLGARFVKLDIGQTAETKGGYAAQLTEEQLKRQREQLAKVIAQADVVVTTAQVFGKKAPLIVTADMVRGMQPGSVIVDLAVETGGNVEGAKLDQEVNVGGVTILGLANLPGKVASSASQMYSSNLANLVEHFWNKQTKSFDLNTEDEILKGCLVTQAGAVCNELVKRK